MSSISKDRFVEIKNYDPGRRCFADFSGIHAQATGNPYFKAPFTESIKPIFEASTEIRLRLDKDGSHCYCYLNTDEDRSVAQEWIDSQGPRVFLRDCLTCSIALGVNMTNVETGERTDLGELEYQAKTHTCEKSTQALADRMAAAIESLPLYKDTGLIAAVPARPGKTTADLPTELAKRIAEAKGLTDLTPHFQYGGVREQLKTLPLSERWDAWEGAQLSICDEGKDLLDGNPVILIDDKYQSGVSANFVGMILQQAGASEILGLYAVKTMRDTDNQG